MKGRVEEISHGQRSGKNIGQRGGRGQKEIEGKPQQEAKREVHSCRTALGILPQAIQDFGLSFLGHPGVDESLLF